MPTLEPDIAAKYKQACPEAEDRLNLRAFSEADESTSHGGHPHQEDMRRFMTDPCFRFDMFKHQPFHDAESVYWCIAAFVLLAKPLNNDEDKNQKAFNKMWRCLAEHEVAEENDKRCSLIQDFGWERWLHQDLSFIAELMADLSFQVKPEWTLLTPAPDPLHLHEAMQRLILQYVHHWEKDQANVELDTVHYRTFTSVERKPMAPVSKHPLIGQIIITSSTLGKRGSNSLAGRALPGSKRKSLFCICSVPFCSHVVSQDCARWVTMNLSPRTWLSYDSAGLARSLRLSRLSLWNTRTRTRTKRPHGNQTIANARRCWCSIYFSFPRMSPRCILISRPLLLSTMGFPLSYLQIVAMCDAITEYIMFYSTQSLDVVLPNAHFTNPVPMCVTPPASTIGLCFLLDP